MGAGSSFIRQDELPQQVQDNIDPLKQHFDIKNAIENPVRVAGKIRLSVQSGVKTEEVKLLVPEKLATAVILGCHYCDQHVKSINPPDALSRWKMVRLRPL